jgi:hypothetical protein
MACLFGKLRGGWVSGSRNTRNVLNVGKEEQLSEDNISDSEYEVNYLKINCIQSEKSDPLIIQLKINNKNVKMEIDTSSEISVMSKQDFERQFGKKKLNQLDPTKTILRTFSGKRLSHCILQKLKLNIRAKGNT